MIAIPRDVYDKDGNMIKIEFHAPSGEFLVDAVWDERDKQTSEKRTEFRKWAYDFVEHNFKYEVLK
jgi:hypothetical protein